jgi:hypothetical protein
LSKAIELSDVRGKVLMTKSLLHNTKRRYTRKIEVGTTSMRRKYTKGNKDDVADGEANNRTSDEDYLIYMIKA